jgi:hypothetical protein
VTTEALPDSAEEGEVVTAAFTPCPRCKRLVLRVVHALPDGQTFLTGAFVERITVDRTRLNQDIHTCGPTA